MEVADKPPAARELRLTPRDVQLLAFVAEHRLVLETHVQALLGSSPDATRTRLRALARSGYITYRRVFNGEPACCQIRRPGLAVIGSRLPAARLNLACYDHDVGAAWLCLAARGGTFGRMRRVIGERELRSHDRGRDREAEPYGVRLGGVGPRGEERLHYPDLLLVTPRGQRLALELELTPKGRARRENILAGYGADARVDAVLYLVEKGPLRRAIEVSAARMGVSDRVHVEYFRWGERRPTPEHGAVAGRGFAAAIEASR